MPIRSAAAQSAALRERLARVASELADAEVKIAEWHDKLAAQQPDRAAEYRKVADQGESGGGGGPRAGPPLWRVTSVRRRWRSARTPWDDAPTVLIAELGVRAYGGVE